MTRDPAEGVDADGYLVTGADVARIPAVYRPVLDDCAATVTAAFGDRLDGLYLYGSVATGQARPPESDIDLLALWTSTMDNDEVAAVATELSTRHRALAREVALAQATRESMRLEADQAFLKHYCVPLTGRDIRPELPRFRPSRALADGFNDDLPALVHRLRSTVDEAPTPAARLAATRKAARRLLMAAATIESVSHSTWSTDRATGAALLARHHPQWTDVAARALDWSAGRGTADGVEDLLAMGDWLARHP
ncbi:MAG TPA: nucleotidyltransferase domain-containing protein [Mycobacteriales bacterium]